MTTDNAILLWHHAHGSDFELTAKYFGLTVAEVAAAVLRANALRRRIEHHDK